MWLLLLIAFIIYLILIIISALVYPFICASIAAACKRYQEIVTCVLLLLTIALYLFACTTLEHSLDNWCYSVYVGIVLTPISLYFCTGLIKSCKWQESGDKPLRGNFPIPLFTFFTSLLFALEGIMRMANSNSIHKLLNNGFISPETESYWSYYDDFQYAGSILFFVSISSALLIGILFFIYYKEYKRQLIIEVEKKKRIEGDINRITQKLEKDFDLLASFGSRQEEQVLLYYNSFCKTIIDVLEFSDEKIDLSYEYRSFNDIDSPYKILLITYTNRSFYFFPTAIVYKSSNDMYKYIPLGKMTISMKTEQITKNNFLPNDVRPIHQFWQHTCRDGSPDLRYKYNPMTLVYKYALLALGDLTLHVYRINAAKYVVSAYNKMYSSIVQYKVQNRLKMYKHHDKMNASQNEKNSICDDIIENKEVVQKVMQSEDVKTLNQNNTVENPKTLEDCFYNIILKSGKHVLADKKLVNLISVSYNEVEIKEYKDVLERMVCDNFLYQFIEDNKQNDFALYNLTSSFARQKKVNVQKSLFITQALVSAIKKVKTVNVRISVK